MGTAAGTGMSSKLSRPPDSVPSRVYQPTYRNYTAPYNIAVDRAITGSSGLADTPQAKMYNSYAPQMPTFSRPEMTPPPPSGGFGRFPMQALSPQPAYRIPMGAPQGLAPSSPFGRNPLKTAVRDRALTEALQNNNLTYAQYEQMMAKPDLYLPYVQSVKAGNAPTTIGYQQRASIPYMTAAQREAYNNAQSRQLSELLGPAPADPNASNSEGD